VSARTGFVSLDRLRQKAQDKDARTALAEIRRIYFRTTRRTIEHDFAAAIELLMGMPSEEDREKATVFMHGLEEMRREWTTPRRPPAKAKNGKRT
jgi:hypothetical protein